MIQNAAISPLFWFMLCVLGVTGVALAIWRLNESLHNGWVLSFMMFTASAGLGLGMVIVLVVAGLSSDGFVYRAQQLTCYYIFWYTYTPFLGVAVLIALVLLIADWQRLREKVKTRPGRWRGRACLLTI